MVSALPCVPSSLPFRPAPHGSRPPAGDGTAKQVDLRNKDALAIAHVLQQMRDVSTGRVRRFKTPVHSLVPSVQGVWDPSTHYDGFQLRVAKLPAAPDAAAPAAPAPAGSA